MEHRLINEAILIDIKDLTVEEMNTFGDIINNTNLSKDYEFCTAIISNDALNKFEIEQGTKLLIKKIEKNQDLDLSYQSIMESLNRELVVLKLQDTLFVRHCQANHQRNVLVFNSGIPKVPLLAAFSKDKIINLLSSVFGIVIGTM